jgi:intraflagellar transport protein 88
MRGTGLASRAGPGLMSRAGGSQPMEEHRPMTAVRAAGYTSAGKQQAAASVFDPTGQGGPAPRGPAPPLAEKRDNSPEDMCREIEKEVNKLIEESAQLAAEKQTLRSLDKAKEAGKRERHLCKQREQHGLSEQINIDLTYSVCFNLANQYHANGLYSEALNTYSLIVKNKQYAQSGRLRVNMGNIYYEQAKYPAAIKMYRMALDQIPATGKEVKSKILRNIGNAFVRLGQFQDALSSYEQIMESAPDVHTGFNLVLCYYALGDRERQRRGFTKLLSVRQLQADADKLETMNAADVSEDDGVKAALRERIRASHKYLSTASKLLVSTIDADVVSGYEWVAEALSAAGQHELATEMSIGKALHFMRSRQFDKAIETLKSYEKQEASLVAHAATNLSFIYFHEGDFGNAIKYADLAMRHNRYNAKALVNKGNCLFLNGELEHARALYQEAMGAEADCLEAVYNLATVNKRLGDHVSALGLFEKLHQIIPHSIEVIWQIADLFDLSNQPRLAIKWFKILSARVPTDPSVLSRLGNIYLKEDDEAQAYHYHHESYRYYPVDMNVISWLGAYFVKNEMYEKAVEYFERAAQIQPGEVKWKLMVASCHRRSGDYQLAFDIYQRIHSDYPENVECLRYLVHICDDLGKKDQVHEYVVKLRKAERAVEASAPPAESQAQMPPQQHQAGYGGSDQHGGTEDSQGERGPSAFQQAMVAAAAGAPRAPPPKSKAAKPPSGADDDLFADDDLDDNLLPS